MLIGRSLIPVSENDAPDPAFDATDETFTNISPGTYARAIVVDV